MKGLSVREPGKDERILVPAESKEDPECLKRKFLEICNSQTNVTMERDINSTHEIRKLVRQFDGRTDSQAANPTRLQWNKRGEGDLQGAQVLPHSHRRKAVQEESSTHLDCIRACSSTA